MDDKRRWISNCSVCGATGIIYLCDTYNEHSKTTSASRSLWIICPTVSHLRLITTPFPQPKFPQILTSDLDRFKRGGEVKSPVFRSKTATVILSEASWNVPISRSGTLLSFRSLTIKLSGAACRRPLQRLVKRCLS